MKISKKSDSSKSNTSIRSHKPFFSTKSNEKSSGFFFNKAPEIIQKKEQSLNKEQWPGSDIEFPLGGASWNGNAITNANLTNQIQQLDNLIANNPNVFPNQGITIIGYDAQKVAAVAGLFNRITATQRIDPDLNIFGDNYGADRVGLNYLKLGTLNRRGRRQLNNILQFFRNFVSN